MWTFGVISCLELFVYNHLKQVAKSIDRAILPYSFQFCEIMIVKLLSLLLIAALGIAHEGHHETQMPLDYVRFPYQARYPGDNEGIASDLSILTVAYLYV